ncbi:MAG: hypothetical protein HKN87_15490 [Saprospiraceae bacterium]|nr:hypothetical protein [Saprospiraceae bacterium]
MCNYKMIIFILCLTESATLAGQSVAGQIPLTLEIREGFIQKALQLREAGNFSAAIDQLDSILSAQGNDAPTLLLKGDLLAQDYQFDEAVNTYQDLLALDYEKTITQINLSYALFMNHKPSQALPYARGAWQRDTTNAGAIVNYFNALLWNLETRKAAAFLSNYGAGLEPDRLLVMQARLYTTSGNYQGGLKYYDSLASNYPNKYYIREYIEVLLAKKEIRQSANLLEHSRQYFTSNECHTIEQKIQAARMQNVGTSFSYFKDVAKNFRIEKSAWWLQSQDRAYRFGVRTGSSTLFSSQQSNSRTLYAGLTISEKWSSAWSGQTDISLQRISSQENQIFTTVTGKQSLEFRPNDRRTFGLSFSSDILDFTSTLLGKNIRSNNVGYLTHIMLNGKIGMYSQGSWGTISDGNEKLQFFGSLYHLFSSQPLLKAGINFSALHFSEDKIISYFSPNQFLSTELFGDYRTAQLGSSRLYLNTQAAVGMQRIEGREWEPTLRLEAELNFQINRFESSLKYSTSNVASRAGTGYKYQRLTYKLIWKW